MWHRTWHTARLHNITIEVGHDNRDGTQILEQSSKDHPGALEIKTLNIIKNEYNVPSEVIKLNNAIIEATNNTYIFVTNKEVLAHFVLKMEWLQFVYRWYMLWPETLLHIKNATGTDRELKLLDLPSISNNPHDNPMAVTYRKAPVVHRYPKFLNTNTKINQPKDCHKQAIETINNQLQNTPVNSKSFNFRSPEDLQSQNCALYSPYTADKYWFSPIKNMDENQYLSAVLQTVQDMDA